MPTNPHPEAASPARLVAAVAIADPDRMPRSLADAIAREAGRLGGERLGIAVAARLLMLAGFTAREVARGVGYEIKTVHNLSSLAGQHLARLAPAPGAVEDQARRHGVAHRAEAAELARSSRPLRRLHRRTRPRPA